MCNNKTTLGQLSKQEISLINKICEEFNSIYLEITQLCIGKIVEEESEKSSSEDGKMADSFDLKLALNLLPVMTDDDDNTKQLIEGIEYYSAVLSKTECKTKLIQFVLKSRLSQKAKLKLQQTYTTIDELIRDMQKILLPQKSHMALQTKLLQCRQNNRSISDFGKEISELFVDLTISQSEGNSANSTVLRSLNEKLAIKRFADGLQNRRISTIIAARDFKSLSEAVQAAQDEEIGSAPSNSPAVMGMYKQTYYRNNSFRRTQRGQNRGQRSFTSSRGRYQNAYTRGHNPWPQRQSARNNYRANYSRGRYNGGRGQSGPPKTIHILSPDNNYTDDPKSPDNNDTDDPNRESLNHFFRA